MAIGTKSDFIIYDEQFYAGQVETLQREVNAFNAASSGCIQLLTNIHKGDFEKESFFKNSAHIYHRDPTSTAAQTPTSLSMDDASAPKSNKAYLVENTLDSFKKLGTDDREMSFVLGQQLALQIMDDYLTHAFSALIGGFAVAGVAADLSVNKTTQAIDSLALNEGISKLGDAANRIGILVMHSKPYFDLIGQQVTDKLLEVTAGNLYQGVPATYGRPTLVVDNPALFSAGSSTASSADDVYHSFGLLPGAVQIQESEEKDVLAERVGGKHNLIARLQGEYAFTTRMRGMDYTGASNPDESVLAVSSNWAKVRQDKRDLMGFELKTR